MGEACINQRKARARCDEASSAPLHAPEPSVIHAEVL